MHVNVKILGGKEITLNLEEDVSVLVLKQKIERESNISVDSQKLILKGKTLSDQKFASEYGFAENTKLHLVVKKNSQITATKKYTGEDFWKTLHRILSKNFNEEETKKVMKQMEKDYSKMVKSMSLDDIERVALRQLLV